LKKVLFDNQNPKLNPINEVKLMNSLENCNVIKCFGYFSKKEKLYILMEFADDGFLIKFVKKAYYFPRRPG
jgi:serine/threonine protein kinase